MKRVAIIASVLSLLGGATLAITAQAAELHLGSLGTLYSVDGGAGEVGATTCHGSPESYEMTVIPGTTSNLTIFVGNSYSAAGGTAGCAGASVIPGGFTVTWPVGHSTWCLRTEDIIDNVANSPYTSNPQLAQCFYLSGTTGSTPATVTQVAHIACTPNPGATCDLAEGASPGSTTYSEP